MFQKWISKRYLRPGKVRPSDLVDVRDTEGIWCAAVVKEIIEMGDSHSLLIHYIGWSSLYDEVIETENPRLTSYRFYTGRFNIPRY